MRTIYTTRRPRYVVQAYSGWAFSNKEWHRSRLATFNPETLTSDTESSTPEENNNDHI